VCFFPLDADLGISHYAIKFLKPGVYPFECPYHSYTGMVGTITVCDDNNYCGSDSVSSGSDAPLGTDDDDDISSASYVMVSKILILFVILVVYL